MQNIIDWIRNNKLTSVLLLILALVLFQGTTKNKYGNTIVSDAVVYQEAAGKRGLEQVPAQQRRVITSSSFSLLVEKVVDTADAIKLEVEKLGGYVINTNISHPESGDYAYLSIRVPTDKVPSIQKLLRDKSVKVVNENISGDDITDQYIDIQERLTKLENTKRRLEEIMVLAKDVDEIMMVQQNIFNLQDQIDSYKGQLKYMNEATATSLISIDLSTDELALPYTPLDVWRPGVVFKLAVRSMLGTLQQLGTAAIWLAVYAVLLVPVLIAVKLGLNIIRKRQSKVL